VRAPIHQVISDYYHIWTYNPRFYSLSEGEVRAYLEGEVDGRVGDLILMVQVWFELHGAPLIDGLDQRLVVEGAKYSLDREHPHPAGLGLGSTVRYSAVGVGVNSALQCGWGWSYQCFIVRLGLELTVLYSAVGVGVNSALQCGWGWS